MVGMGNVGMMLVCYDKYLFIVSNSLLIQQQAFF